MMVIAKSKDTATVTTMATVMDTDTITTGAETIVDDPLSR